MIHAQSSSPSDMRLRAARTNELDEVARLLAEVYGAFRGHLPAGAWEHYIGEIIGLHTAAHMVAATRLYERLGFRRAPEFDIEIGEMFTGRSLPPGDSWEARAYRLNLEEVLT